MAEAYPWISEGSIRKYHRALEKLRKENKEATEAAVKELYVKMGGLVLEETPEEAPVEETPKRGRKAKEVTE